MAPATPREAGDRIARGGAAAMVRLTEDTMSELLGKREGPRSFAAHNRCTPAEADAQLRASQRAAWRMVASDAELALGQEHADG